MTYPLLAIGAGKFAATLAAWLRVGSGTSLPGKVARRLDPDILRKLGQQIRQETVAVTGTNGKTTTCGLLAQFLREANQQVIHNQLGANMVSGITASLVRQSSLSGRLDADVGVLEVDEASLKGLAGELSLKRVAVTNLFRDQLDRYGELDTTARLIREGLEKTGLAQGQGSLILNADDPLVTTLGTGFENVLYYGIESFTYQHTVEIDCPVDFHREVSACPACGETLHYTDTTFGHLGHYDCLHCSYVRPTPTVFVRHVNIAPDHSTIDLQYGNEAVLLNLPMPGLFNVYNLLAAAAVAHNMGLPATILQAGIDHCPGVFGRAERRTINGKSALIMLIKNPIGASEVLKLVAADPKGRLLIAINDNYADGRDVSWLWDAQFERVAEGIGKTRPVIISGQRAEDMALRLKYAGMPLEHLQIEPNLRRALQKATEQTTGDETLYVLPTYTALLTLKQMAD